MLFGSDFPVITPDRWLADFAELDIKPEARPLILKETRPACGPGQGCLRTPDYGVGSWPHRRARIDPHRAALREGDRILTYRELAGRVDALAGAMAANGVERGDRIAYLGGNSIAGFEVFFAACPLGAIYLPLNTRLSVPELAYIVADCAPVLLVHGRAQAPLRKELSGPPRRCGS